MTASPSRYNRVAVFIHWVLAALIIGLLIGGNIMTRLEGSAFKYELFQLHKSTGIVILLLSLFRLFWRLTHRPPALPDGMKTWERAASKITHWGFYVLMIGIPLSGWAMVSAAPTVITTKIYKLIRWPDFPGLTRSETLHGKLENAHEVMGYAMIVLLLLHVGAALKHHFVNRDDVLARMIPRLEKKGTDHV